MPPYGHDLFGVVSPINEDACHQIKRKVSTEPTVFQDILLLREGNCSILTSILNAQQAGAVLAILIRKPSASIETPLASNDFSDLSTKITIPAIYVSTETGEKLISVASGQKKVILKLHLPVPKENKVDLEFHIRLNDSRIQVFLGEFVRFVEQFEDNLNIKFVLFKRSEVDLNVQKMQSDINCLQPADAMAVLSTFQNDCPQHDFECFEAKVNELPKSIRDAYLACVKRSATEFFKLQKSLPIESSNTKSFVLVNKMYFTGSLTPENLFNAVCSGFLVSPGQCLYVDNKYTLNTKYLTLRGEHKANMMMLLLVDLLILVILLGLAAFVMVLVFGRIYKRILDERVGQIVQESISSYETLRTMN